MRTMRSPQQQLMITAQQQHQAAAAAVSLGLLLLQTGRGLLS
jgi:hypothetical protein